MDGVTQITQSRRSRRSRRSCSQLERGEAGLHVPDKDFSARVGQRTTGITGVAGRIGLNPRSGPAAENLPTTLTMPFVTRPRIRPSRTELCPRARRRDRRGPSLRSECILKYINNTGIALAIRYRLVTGAAQHGQSRILGKLRIGLGKLAQ
jgi:hypothetical protein